MTTHYIKFKDKEESKNVRWLEQGSSKDKQRQILNGLHIKNGETWAASGFVAHRTATPDSFKPYAGKTLRALSNIPTKPNQVVEFEEIPGNYPDVESALAKAEENDTVFEIHVSAKLLSETLKNFPTNDAGMVTLTFYAKNLPLKVTSDDALAIVMPMHKPD